MSNQDIVAEIHAIAQTAIQEGKQLLASHDATAAAGRFENGLGDIVKVCSEASEAPSAVTAETEAPAASE